MIQYDYICRDTGERRSLLRKSMKDAPPIKFNEYGKAWERDWGDVKGHVGSKGQGPRMKGWAVENIAPTLPPNESPYRETQRNGAKVREHADGTFSDSYGHRIVDGQKDMHKTCAKLGLEYVPGA